MAPAFAGAQSALQDSDRRTLDAARSLAGRPIAAVPVVVASVLRDGAFPGIEAWTVFSSDGKGERIVVYTGSEIFRCASRGKDHQCLLRLASALVHEAWHFRHGPGEDGAYAAQMVFLMANQGAPEHVASVRLSRDRAIAAQRRAIEAAKRTAQDQRQ
jgi:hypothetical protein